MKIRKFELRDFIQVDSQTQQFGDASLVLLHGPNESGKSTFLEAIRQSLFGFANTTVSRSNKISATVDAILKNGDQLTFTRRRKRNAPVEGTLIGSTGTTQIDEQQLLQCFDGCDRALYEQLFGFSLEDVTRGEERLKHASLQEALLGASQSSSISWQNINQSFIGERESLAKARSRTLPLDKSVAEIERLKNQIQSIEVRASEFRELQREQDLLDRETKDLKRQIDEIQTEIDREKLQRSLVPDAQQWLDLRTQIDALRIPKELDRKWIDQYKKRQNEQDARIEEKNGLQKDLESRQSDQSNNINTESKYDRSLLSNEDRIVELSRQSAILDGGSQSAEVDLQKRQSLIEQIESTAAAMQFRNVHYSELLNRASQLDRNTLDELCKEWAETSLQLESNQKELASQVQKQTDLQNNVTSGPAISAETLTAIESGATQLENHIEKHQTATDLVESLAKELSSDLQLEPDFQSHWNLDSIASTAEFDPKLLLSFAEKIEKARAKVHTTESAIRELDSRREELNRELLSLEIPEDLPTRSDLDALRKQRRMLIETLRDSSTDEIDLFGNQNQELSKELVELIDREELIVDAILDSAELFAKRDSLAQQLDELEKRVQSNNRELKKSKKATATTCTEYFECWPESWWQSSLLQCTDLIANAPIENLRAWPTLLNRWRGARQRIKRAEKTAQRTATTLDSNAKQLSDLLKHESAANHFSELLAENSDATQFVNKIRKRSAELRNKQSESSNQKVLLAAAVEAIEKLKQEGERLTKQFDQQQAALSGFLMPISRTLRPETPKQSQTISRQIEMIANWREPMRELESAIEARKTAEQKFLQNAAELLESLNRQSPEDLSDDSSAPKSDLSKWNAAIQKTDADLIAAKKRAAASLLNEETIRNLQKRIEEKVVDHKNVEQTINDSLNAIGNPDSEQLAIWLENFDQWQQQISNHQQIGKRLTAAISDSNAESVEQFAARISQPSESQSSPSDSTKLEKKKLELSEELESKNDSLSRQRERIEQLKSRTQLEELHQQLESQYAELSETVEQYMTLTLAESLLKRTLQADQHEDSDSLLAIAGDILANLTDGRYARIVHAKSKNKSSFVLTDNNGMEKAPAELSTGTREQLFLAIRLAFISQYCESHEPMPIVMDDCFVNFDDQRLKSTIKALGQFDSNIQILLLSCQNRTLDTVNEFAPDSQIVSFSEDAFVSN